MNRLTIRPSTFATTPCDEGYSNWHLVALGLLDTWHAREFIESTIDAPGSVLLDDLLEHTTQPIGAHWKAPRRPVCGATVQDAGDHSLGPLRPTRCPRLEDACGGAVVRTVDRKGGGT